ncbi:MAG: cyclic pyranopterin monophosphate synthase MoaC [candidate division Zixibacteria bacterium]|nr:cyclic pyranopterin monophosphate synthase MoaC [candidate division Zixibacteria bacterium]
MQKNLHRDRKGKVRMVDVGDKKITRREAKAFGVVKMRKETLRLIQKGEIPKGDVLGCAKIAGILAAKKTHHLIPMCHPLPLNWIDLSVRLNRVKSQIEVESEVKVEAKTGVEMEALTAVSIAALTIYDMCKGMDKEMEIRSIYLLKKKGGRSGTYSREKRK